MTHRTRLSLELSTANRAPARAGRIARGLVAGAALLGAAWLAVAAPVASPDTVAAPAVKGLYTSVTDTARASYFRALFADGWVLTPAIPIEKSGA